MKISLITSVLSPAAGGLSAAVSNLSHALVKASVEDLHVVGIEDPDDPMAADSWGPHVHAHRVTGPRAFGYAPQKMHSLDRLAPDVTDVQGLWTYPSLANLQHHRPQTARRRRRPLHILDSSNSAISYHQSAQQNKDATKLYLCRYYYPLTAWSNRAGALSENILVGSEGIWQRL